MLLEDTVKPTADIKFAMTEIILGLPVNVTVTLKDEQSGIHLSKCKWIYNQNNKAIGLNENNYSGDFTSETQKILLPGQSQKGDYYLHVLAVDNQENKEEFIQGPIKIGYEEVSSFNFMNYLNANASSWQQLGMTSTNTANDWFRFNNNECGIGAHRNVGNYSATFTMPGELIKQMMTLNGFNNIDFKFALGADSPAWVYGWGAVAYTNNERYQVNSSTRNTGNNWYDFTYHSVNLNNIDIHNISTFQFGVVGYETNGASLGKLVELIFSKK